MAFRVVASNAITACFAELEDDSWADDMKSPAVKAQPTSESQATGGKIALKRQRISHSRSRNIFPAGYLSELSDDTWADELQKSIVAPRLPRELLTPRLEALGYSSERIQTQACSQTSRALEPTGPMQSVQEAEHSLRNVSASDLEDDSWADAAPSLKGACVQSMQPASKFKGNACLHALEDDSWADSLPARRSVEDATFNSRCTAVSSTNADAKLVEPTVPRAVERGGRGPDIPWEYCTFSGQLIETQLDDNAAAYEHFRRVFSRERFEAAHPSAIGLPLLVGLDFEWKPDRKLSEDNPIAVIQLACWDTALVVRTVGCTDLPSWFTDFLQEPSIIKVTASFDLSDRAKLKKSFGWDFQQRASSSFVDIAELAKERGIPPGMLKMSNFFGVPMQKLKAVGSSNWARQAGLTVAQLGYAADDAFFQLYFLGLLFEHRGPQGADCQLVQCHKAWCASKRSMDACVKRVDNREYRQRFFELRDVVHGAVDALSRALGSGGCTTINSINAFASVRKVLLDSKAGCKIPVGAHFLKQNADIFVTFVASGEIKVRLRSTEDDDDDANVAADDFDIEDFFAEVVDLLVRYEPPVEKRPSIHNRTIPEPEWVPAKALFNKLQRIRFESLTQTSDLFETSYSDDDGILLRLLRHPQAPDDQAHLERCTATLQAKLGVGETHARAVLNADERFMKNWGALRLVKEGSTDEMQISKNLQARLRVLVDSHLLVERLREKPAARNNNATVDWMSARDGLQQVKWYRQLLSGCLTSSGNHAAENRIHACLDMIANAWPDLKSVKAPSLSGGSKKGKGRGKCASKDRHAKEKMKGAAAAS